MNRSALVGTVFGVTIATAAAGIAGYSMLDNSPSAATPVATEDCYQVEVEDAVDPKDKRRIAGTVVGGLVGGAVGKDVGDRDITTVAGAAVGAVIGNQAQKKLQENRTVTTTETRCVPAE